MQKDVQKMPRWYRLDNAAKIYPVVTNSRRSHVFRIAANMKHDIDPPALQQAVIDCKNRFPTIYVKLRTGFFWYYYEPNEKKPIVRPESPYLNQSIDRYLNNGYFFTFFYFKKRLSLECYHGICDGAGAIEFFKTVILHYLELIGYKIDSENIVLSLSVRPTKDEAEDSYLKYFPEGKRKRQKVAKAYKPLGKRFRQGGTGLINVKLKTSDLLALSKTYNASLSQFLAALMTYSIFLSGDKKQLAEYPVKITIPVNMRSIYPSKTLRNFSLFFRTSIKAGDSNMSFSDILTEIQSQFAEELKLENLNDTLYFNVSIEKNIVVKFLPLFVKIIILRTGYYVIGKRATTAALSNLGNINLPSGMKEHVESMEVNLSGSSYATPDVSVISCNGIISLSFSRGTYGTEVERAFIGFLTEKGLNVEVTSNNWEEFA